MGRGNPKNPRAASTPTPDQTEHIAKALQYHTAGMDYTAIAATMKCSRSTAHRWVTKGIRIYLAESGAEQAGATMQLQLLAAIRAIWPKVLQGDLGAVDRLVRLQTRWAALTGADAPARHTVTVLTEDAVDAAIRELEAEMQRKALGAGNDEPDDGPVIVAASVVIR